MLHIHHEIAHAYTTHSSHIETPATVNVSHLQLHVSHISALKIIVCLTQHYQKTHMCVGLHTLISDAPSIIFLCLNVEV